MRKRSFKTIHWLKLKRILVQPMSKRIYDQCRKYYSLQKNLMSVMKMGRGASCSRNG